jgi:hypothetical protein
MPKHQIRTNDSTDASKDDGRQPSSAKEKKQAQD